MKKVTVALMGAGGKMGCRLTDNLKNHPDYEMLYIEINPAGVARMAEKGVSPTPQDEAFKRADVVILAVPDALIGKISHAIINQLRPGTILMGLDPAAGHAEVLPKRDDVTYFAAHPCHPPLFMEELTKAAQTDWFGGYHARQSVVCALIQGPEEHYAIGEKLSAAMYAPILRMHRISVEQMAILEPGVVETTCATLVWAMKESLDEAIKMGVPEQAAWDFVMGHIRIELAIIFGYAGFPFSDGAKLAIENAKQRIFLPNWKENVLSREAVKQQVMEITHAGK
ncbi:MAG: phosphogluconate dehydrogenase C-terminal domain-containing protein [Verrucomicrobiota bacterium]|nr:phosphogluconate dehydrogenase C-terminal domain-containing protein [Verrucomicrobiota bacterium]